MEVKGGLYLILYEIRSLFSAKDNLCSLYLLLAENDNLKPDHRPGFLTHPHNPFISTKAELQFLRWPSSHGDPTTRTTSCVSFSTMQYFGGKLSAAQLQVAGWVGSVRRSLQGALELVWGNVEEKQEEEDGDKEEEESGDGEGRFQRAMSPLRSFARRSRRSLRRFSLRSGQTLHRRATETCSVRADIVTQEMSMNALQYSALIISRSILMNRMV